MATRRWVQGSFLDARLELRLPREPQHRAGRPRSRHNHIRVTRDAGVALAWAESHQLSAEVTWQLARALSREQIDELRLLIARQPPSGSSS